MPLPATPSVSDPHLTTPSAEGSLPRTQRFTTPSAKGSLPCTQRFTTPSAKDIPGTDVKTTPSIQDAPACSSTPITNNYEKKPLSYNGEQHLSFLTI